MQTEEIKELYRKLKHIRANGIIIGIAACIATAFIIAAVFPELRSLELMLLNPVAWLVCILIEIVAIFIYCSLAYMKNLNKFSKILAEDCDLEKYTETLCEGINYGKNIKLSKYQKALFLSLQRMYAETLCLSKALDEAQRFLNEEWVGDKKVDFELAETQIGLMTAYINNDRDTYAQIYKTAPLLFKRSKIYAYYLLILQGKDDEALQLLSGHSEKHLYGEVLRHFRLAEHYLKEGNSEAAKEHIEFVINHGNTLPQKQIAEGWKHEGYRPQSKAQNTHAERTAFQRPIKSKKSALFIYASLIVITVLITLFITTSNAYVREGIPEESKGAWLDATYEVYDNKIYFSDSSAGEHGRLMAVDTETLFKTAKKLDINGVRCIKKGGDNLYILTEKQVFIFDLNKETVIAKVDLSAVEEDIEKEAVSSYELKYADEDGGYIVIEGDRRDKIICVNALSEVRQIAQFDDMEGTINRLIRYENSLIIGYMTSSEEKSGTYCFDIEKGTMEKYSDICGSAFENNISGFIWKDYYCLPTFNTVYLISLSGKENKEIDMGGLCTDMYLDGDYLYRGDSYALKRYNLATGELEVSNQRKSYFGKIIVDDGTLYLGYCIKKTPVSYKTRVFTESLESHQWQ